VCDRLAYGPNRILADELAALSEIEVSKTVEIVMGEKAHRNWDQEYFGAHGQMVLRSHPIPIRTPARLRDVELAGGTILLKDGRVIEESGMSQHEYLLKARRSPQVVFRRLAPTLHIDEAVCLTSAMSKYYFHWITEELPRAIQLADLGALREGVKIIIDGAEAPFQAQTLQALLGVRAGDIVHRADVEDRRVVIGKCWIPFYNHLRTVETEMVEFLPAAALVRLRELAAPVGRTLSPRSIFIQRPPHLERHVTNADLVQQQLPGLETVAPEHLSFVEQVELFRSAKVIISPHGAGLANTVFSQDALIVELFPRGRAADLNYLQMATALSLDHHIICVNADPENLHITLSQADVEYITGLVNARQEKQPK